MALLFMDSFDHYALADQLEKWSSLTAAVGVDDSAIAAVGRHSSQGYKNASHGLAGGASAPPGFHKLLSPADNTFILGMAVNSITPFTGMWTNTDPTSFTTSSFLVLRNAGANQCWIRVNTDGTLSVYRDATLLGTTSAALTQGAYAYVEILLTIHNTTGVVTLRFDGTTVLSLTSQNTRAGAANAWNEFRLGFTGALGSQTVEFDYDDLYVCDGSGAAPWNTFLGDVRVDVRRPTGAGATTQFTPSAGANWQCVDDAAPNDDTDSTTSATTNHVDTFTVENAPVAGATIYGIQHCLNLKKSDAGPCTVAPVIRHSGTDYAGAPLSPGTSYTYGLQIAQTNPGTSAQWTEADFNAAEFGYKKTS
jgi:hypothetical protein